MSLTQILFESSSNADNCKVKEGSFADAIRKDLIENFLSKIDDDDEINYLSENPDEDLLLEPDHYDGYEYQTYIQYISPNEFIYWEGFSNHCWRAFLNQTQYKNMNKEQIIDSFISNRAKNIAQEFGYILDDYDYYIHTAENVYGELYEDYILKLNYKKLN